MGVKLYIFALRETVLFDSEITVTEKVSRAMEIQTGEEFIVSVSCSIVGYVKNTVPKGHGRRGRGLGAGKCVGSE